MNELSSPVVDYDEVYDQEDEVVELPSDNVTHDNGKNKEDFMQNEDPRFRNGVKKLVKKGGVGRNTESFDPKSTLVRPDMRILVGSKSSKPAELKHDDVLVVPDFFCDANNWDLYNTLVDEMRALQKQGEKGSEWISWHEGAHLISKNPTNSVMFQKILSQVADYFSIQDITSMGTRFNWYRDANDWKPFHHDSAAFNRDRAKRQNITVGVSFGATRELAFLHAKNNTRIYFPQTNGMLFSFGRDVNINWKHGVNFCAEEIQKLQEKEYAGFLKHDVTLGRISIILWGLCGVTVEETNSPPMLTDNTRGNGHHMHNAHLNKNREQNNHNMNRRERTDSRDRRHDRDHSRNRDNSDRNRVDRDRERDRGNSRRSRERFPSSAHAPREPSSNHYVRQERDFQSNRRDDRERSYRHNRRDENNRDRSRSRDARHNNGDNRDMYDRRNSNSNLHR